MPVRWCDAHLRFEQAREVKRIRKSDARGDFGDSERAEQPLRFVEPEMDEVLLRSKACNLLKQPPKLPVARPHLFGHTLKIDFLAKVLRDEIKRPMHHPGALVKLRRPVLVVF